MPYLLKHQKKGRPLKYKPELCKKIVEYFTYPLTHTVLTPIYSTTGKVIAHKEVKEVSEVRTIEGFSVENDVDVETLQDWSKKYKDFSVAYKKARQLQKQKLVDGTLRGLYNPVFAIFYAKNITDLRDVRENREDIAITITKQLIEPQKPQLTTTTRKIIDAETIK